jgi:hypothetical protein
VAKHHGFIPAAIQSQEVLLPMSAAFWRSVLEVYTSYRDCASKLDVGSPRRISRRQEHRSCIKAAAPAHSRAEFLGDAAEINGLTTQQRVQRRPYEPDLNPIYRRMSAHNDVGVADDALINPGVYIALIEPAPLRLFSTALVDRGTS